LKKLFSVVLLFSSLTGISQVKFNSLWSAWSNPLLPDTARLEAIQEIAWNGFLYTKPDSTFYCAQLAYDFAKTKGLKKYMATAVNIQGASWAGRGEYAEAIKYYKELIRDFPSTEHKSTALERISNITTMVSDKEKYVADFYFKTEDYQSSLHRYLSIFFSICNLHDNMGINRFVLIPG